MLGIFLDSETNGLNPRKHALVEIAFKIIDVFSGELLEAFQSVITLSSQAWANSDPESLKVNGFTWEEVSKQGLSPLILAERIINCFETHQIKRGNAVFICQNPSFDRAFFSQLIDTDIQERLLWPYHWLDLASMYWAEGIRKGKENPKYFPWKTGVSKDKISNAHDLAPEAKPHRAMNGVDHLLLCYETVVGFPGR